MPSMSVKGSSTCALGTTSVMMAILFAKSSPYHCLIHSRVRSMPAVTWTHGGSQQHIKISHRVM
jgi:hypothetical protein